MFKSTSSSLPPTPFSISDNGTSDASEAIRSSDGEWSLLKQLTVVTLGRGIGFALAIGTNILLVRLLGPAEYGFLALSLALITMCIGIFSEALDVAILRFLPLQLAANSGRAELYFLSAVILKGIFMAGLIIAGFLAMDSVGTWLSLTEGRTELLGWTLVGVAGTMLLRSCVAYYQAMHQLRRFVYAELCHTLCKLIFVGSCAAMGVLTAANAVAGLGLIALVVGVITCGYLVKSEGITLKLVPEQTAEVWHFTKWVMLSFTIATIYSRADIPLLAHFRGATEVGHYSAAITLSSVSEIILSFAGGAVTPKIMVWMEQGRMTEFLRRCLLYGIAPCLIAIGAVWILAEPVIGLLYSETYRPAVLLFQILSTGTLLWCLALPLAAPLVCMHRPRWEVLQNILVLLLMAGGSVLLIPSYGAIGIAYLVSSLKILTTVISLWLAFKVASTVQLPHGMTGAHGREGGML